MISQPPALAAVAVVGPEDRRRQEAFLQAEEVAEAAVVRSAVAEEVGVAAALAVAALAVAGAGVEAEFSPGVIIPPELTYQLVARRSKLLSL